VKILVAGGAGFVGSHVCRELLVRGHDVDCLDNLSTGSRSNVEDFVGRQGFVFSEEDVTAARRRQVDLIVHLASPASPVDYGRLPLETLAANSMGTWRLIDLAAETGARFTFVSTSEVYGDPLVHPQPETYWGNVDPIGPRSCYDEGKRVGEALVTAARLSRGVKANIVRLFNTYGPRMRMDDGRVIPELLSAALRDRPLIVHGQGTQTRSFCYVSDIVAGILAVVLDPDLDGGVLNIGSPHEMTILELAETIRRLIRPDAQIIHVLGRTGDPERRRPVIDRMIDRYGWHPVVPLEDGLLQTAEAFRATLNAA
jgi:dTDP-glucose 4,6-dehydratase